MCDDEEMFVCKVCRAGGEGVGFLVFFPFHIRVFY